jgi:hypothetical protein
MPSSLPARHKSLFSVANWLFIAALWGVGGCSSDPGSSAEGQGQKYQVLRKNIGVQLSKVASFAVVGSGPGGQGIWHGGGYSTLLAALEGPGLVALMLTGDVSPVALTEMADGSPNLGQQPPITAIYSTPQWILMSTGGWQLAQPQQDGAPSFLPCPTIAVHRPDGAMYCANLGIRHTGGNGEDLEFPVHANATGSAVFVLSSDSLQRNIVYKLTTGAHGEPSAKLVDPKLHPNWFVVNGSGDMLVQTATTAGMQGETLTQILPVDGSAAVTVTGSHNAYAIAGPAGSPEADTFYAVSGGGGGWPFDGTLRVLKKVSGVFQASDVKVAMEYMNCSGLFPLADGVYMYCGGQDTVSLARVIVGGQVQTSPGIAAFTGFSLTPSVGGLPFRSGGGVFYVLAKGASGQFFARHNGLVQHNIALGASIEVLSMAATAAGGLDLVGVDNQTNSKIRAAIAPGATELTILSAEGVALAEVVVFTRIN